MKKNNEIEELKKEIIKLKEINKVNFSLDKMTEVFKNILSSKIDLTPAPKPVYTNLILPKLNKIG